MKVIAFFILSTFLFVGANAQSPSRTLRTAEKSLGGSKNLKNARSWQMTGTVRRIVDGAAGQFIMQASGPNLFHFSYDLNGFEYEWGYNGRSGWARDSRGGLRTLTGEESVAFQAEANYRNNLWLNRKQDRTRVASGGTAQVNGNNTVAVAIGSARGAGIKIFFNTASGLPLREEFQYGDRVKTFDYADYRSVDGVMRPFSITIRQDDEILELKVERSTLNRQASLSDFDFPQISGQPLPDIPNLLAELQENEDQVEKILDTYSYVQKSTRRELGKDVILREAVSETYQLSFYKGHRIRRLIEKNGKPLNEREQANEDREVEKRVSEIEKRIAREEARENAGRPSDGEQRVSIAEVLRASRLINPRRERFRGRDVIVFDFEPNPSFDPRNANSMLKFFGKVAGVMWIDEKDKQVARLEAFLANSYNIGGGFLAKLRKGATFTLEQERVNNEIWLPSVADIDLSVRVLLVRGVNINQVVRSYDYRKFATEILDSSVENPKDGER